MRRIGQADNRVVGRAFHLQRKAERRGRLRFHRRPLVGSGAGIGAGQGRVDPPYPQVLHHLLMQPPATQDLHFGLDHLIGAGNRAARRVADTGLIDIFLAQPDQQAGMGRITRFQGHGEGDPERGHRQEHHDHEAALAPQSRREVLSALTRTGIPTVRRERRAGGPCTPGAGGGHGIGKTPSEGQGAAPSLTSRYPYPRRQMLDFNDLGVLALGRGR